MTHEEEWNSLRKTNPYEARRQYREWEGRKAFVMLLMFCGVSWGILGPHGMNALGRVLVSFLRVAAGRKLIGLMKPGDL